MAYYYIIMFCTLLIIAHVFNIFIEKHKVPTVIFLIILGNLTQHIFKIAGIEFVVSMEILQILGSIGLVMIVLEGALDLKIEKEKLPVIKRALAVTALLLVVSIASISGIIVLVTGTDFLNAIIYAVPLSIISSAIVIPSVGILEEAKKEFMIYEATFSDVIGILIFNFFAFGAFETIETGTEFVLYTILLIIVSILASLVLIFILGKSKSGSKIVMTIAVLLLVYSVGKMLHLSSLILIFIFGLLLNNFDSLLKKIKVKEEHKKIFNLRNTYFALRELKLINTEISFIIRTFFFFVFGFSIDIFKSLSVTVIVLAVVIVLLIYIVRFINFKLIQNNEIFPEIFIAPRGLITVLLFYSIPAKYHISNFEDGLVFMVIVISSLVMMISLIVYKKPISIVERDEY